LQGTFWHDPLPSVSGAEYNAYRKGLRTRFSVLMGQVRGLTYPCEKGPPEEFCLKILVSNRAGFSGSHVVGAYSQASYEVHVLDDLSHRQHQNLPGQVRVHVMDAQDRSGPELPAYERFNMVNHRAAQIDVCQSVGGPPCMLTSTYLLP